MSILPANAKKHLDELSEPQRTSIRTRIGNRPVANQFIIGNGFIYFLNDDQLVCVKLQEKNGVYQLWFNCRIIELDSTTGKCFIVDFNRKCLEYFCVDEFFQNASINTRYSFLYRLLIQERIDRIDRKSIRSLRIFFTMRDVIGQIERVGKSVLKPHPDCLSIHEMVRGMKEFIRKRFLTCFVRSPPSIFQTALLENPSQRPSVDGFYGIRLFLNSVFRRPSLAFGMISKLMLKFVGKKRMTGVFLKWIANEFFRKMSDSISLNVSRKFIENPIGFRQASGTMDELLESCRKRTNLQSSGFPVNSVTGCVSVMMLMDQHRVELSEKRRDEWFKEQRRLEQEKLREEHQKKHSIQEFRGGIARIKEEVSQAQKRRCFLDEFADGGIEISLEFDETRKRERKFEDFDEFNSCLKFEKFE